MIKRGIGEPSQIKQSKKQNTKIQRKKEKDIETNKQIRQLI